MRNVTGPIFAQREIGDLRAIIIAGLTATRKELPCKLLYDQRGSALFDDICSLPEYYLTRTELAIMRRHVDEMATLLGPRCAVIEFGSGTGVKSRMLLAALHDPVAYIPIDISEQALDQSARAMRKRSPDLHVQPICADYTQPIDLPALPESPARCIAYFPGSTIGNFHPGEAAAFLRRVTTMTGGDGAMLIGVDLKKDRNVIEAAYNDSAGVTAAFNLNVLARINRELGADFHLPAFEHRAVFNERRGRVEMQLISRARQTVRIDSDTIHFDAGEAIITEFSYKYDLNQFAAIAAAGGFEVRQVWLDSQRLFSVQYLAVAPRHTSVR